MTLHTEATDLDPLSGEKPPERNTRPTRRAAGNPADDTLQGGARLAANLADFVEQFAKVLTGIATLAGAAGALVSDGNLRVAAIVAGALGLVGAAWLVKASSHGRGRAREASLESDRSAFRGLIPFQEGDSLPGREQDTTLLYTVVTDREFRVGVVYGDPGVGKTSLLRAGLVPRLRHTSDRHWVPVYVVARPGGGGEDLQTLIRAELERELEGTPRATKPEAPFARASRQGPVVVICDQFEQFFLDRPTPEARAAFFTWVARRVADDDVRFLFALRRGFEACAREMESYLAEPMRGQDQMTVKRFSPEQARDVLRVLAREDGVTFSHGLRAAIVRHLAVDETICPAELQVIGRWLKESGVRTEAAYEGVGRAHGLLRAYLVEELASLHRPSAAHILGLLANGRANRAEILAAVPSQSGLTPPALDHALQRLVQDGLVVQDPDGRYGLVHAYFRNAVRKAVDGRIQARERLLWRARQVGVAYGATAAAGVLAAVVALGGGAATLASFGPRETAALAYPPNVTPSGELVAFSVDGNRFAMHYAGKTLFWTVRGGGLSANPILVDQPLPKGFVPLSLEFKPDSDHLTVVAVQPGLRKWSVSTADLTSRSIVANPSGDLLAGLDLQKCGLQPASSARARVAVAYACDGPASPIDLLADAATPSQTSKTLPRGVEDADCVPVQVAFTPDARLIAAYRCDSGTSGDSGAPAKPTIKLRTWSANDEPGTSLAPSLTGDPQVVGLMTSAAGEPLLALKTLAAVELWNVGDPTNPKRMAWLRVNDFVNPHPVGLSSDGRYLAQQHLENSSDASQAVGLYEMGHWLGPLEVPSLLPATIVRERVS